MIQIIEKGTRKIRKCPECGCKFSFEAEDVKEAYTPPRKYDDSLLTATGRNTYVVCPQCSKKIVICEVR